MSIISANEFWDKSLSLTPIKESPNTIMPEVSAGNCDPDFGCRLNDPAIAISNEALLAVATFRT
jgi:hypothetical protein